MAHEARRWPANGKRCAGCVKNNYLQKVRENPTRRVPQEKPKERHTVERTVLDIQQDSDTSNQEFDIIRPKFLISIVSDLH